eukprot:CAMPEP_0171999062 /NCGR_PEP_ID=MMETSP1041-20130122/1573_1 /TAXON_ID=464988 /ORGANISM="Hemiselmis andersenii, Strain CCMP439" /LENGTH=129 /DNA_ID=CAMNT_0012652485 /DNA_START=149 /DNA_END=538 /DNA_ORIENTATION=-
MDEELQKKLAARRMRSGEAEAQEEGTVPSQQPNRASAPGRLNMPASMGRFNPAAMGGVPSPFAMAGGGAGAGQRTSAPSGTAVGGMPMGVAMFGGSGGAQGMKPDSQGTLDPLPTKAKGPAGRRKPTKL